MRDSFLRLFRVIKTSLTGDSFDLTQMDIRKAVIILSIPMMLELSLESVFAVVDIYFVNQLGAGAVSIVGLTESVMTLIYSVAIGLTAAATASVARRVGEKNLEAAAQYGAQAIVLGLVCSLFIGFLGFWQAEPILIAMGAEADAISEGLVYTKIMFLGNSSILLLFLINGIFRAYGNAAMAMKSLWLGNLFNIILDPIFIFGCAFIPEMGIKGAAIATVIGRISAVLYQIYHLRARHFQLKFKWNYFIPNFSLMKSLYRIAWPATFQFIIASASWIFLAAMVAEYGSEASAGYQTAIRLLLFFILPAWGMSNAVATLVGQNLGAQFPERAENAVAITAYYNAIFMAIVTVFFFFFSSEILVYFIPSEQTKQMYYAVVSLQIISSGYIFYGIGMVFTQAFNGAGDTQTPTWVYFFGFWIFQIPFAYFLQKYTDLQAIAVFWAIPIAETLMTLIIFLLFKQGNWKRVTV